MIDKLCFDRICCSAKDVSGASHHPATRWVRQLITQARIKKTFGGQAMYKASRGAKVRFMKSSVEWWKTCKVFGLWQACLLSGILLLSGTGFAQLSTASLSGAVRDSSGAVVPKGKVMLKNVATAVGHTTTTNDAGAYLFLDITPGRYVVSASAADFGKQQVPEFSLEV